MPVNIGDLTYEYCGCNDFTIEQWRKDINNSKGTYIEIDRRDDRHAVGVRFWHGPEHTYLNYNTGDDPYRVKGKLGASEVKALAQAIWDDPGDVH